MKGKIFDYEFSIMTSMMKAESSILLIFLYKTVLVFSDCLITNFPYVLASN